MRSTPNTASSSWLFILKRPVVVASNKSFAGRTVSIAFEVVTVRFEHAVGGDPRVYPVVLANGDLFGGYVASPDHDVGGAGL